MTTEYYKIPFTIIFGILPSLTWLWYYLRKDLHPEPKRMILKVFLAGALITIPTFFIQIGLLQLLSDNLQGYGFAPMNFSWYSFFENHPLLTALITWFGIIALTEELLKYVVVKVSVLNSYVVDEPLDIMLYMVVAALGFATVENILYIAPLNSISGNIVGTTMILSAFRFIGATFLHTLCCALVGYFVALASLKNKNRLLLTVTGLALATASHGLYDYALTNLPAPFNGAIPVVIILVLAGFMIYDFDEIKKVKSICKL